MIFAVELKYVAMVSAESADEAIQKACHVARDIVSDASGPDNAIVLDRVYTPDQLAQYGWDDRCVPYGHDGNTRLKDILEAQ